MSDFKSVPTIVVNVATISVLPNQNFRLAFAERLDGQTDNYHCAVQIDRRTAQGLLDLLQRLLGGPGQGGAGGTPTATGGSVVLGNTSLH